MTFFITTEETVCALMGIWEARYEMAFSTGVIKMEGPYDDVNSLCKQWLQLTLASTRWAVWNDARKKAPHDYRTSMSAGYKTGRSRTVPSRICVSRLATDEASALTYHYVVNVNGCRIIRPSTCRLVPCEASIFVCYRAENLLVTRRPSGIQLLW